MGLRYVDPQGLLGAREDVALKSDRYGAKPGRCRVAQ